MYQWAFPNALFLWILLEKGRQFLEIYFKMKRKLMKTFYFKHSQQTKYN